MTVTTTDLLTDDMLARFDERAPVVRPREPVLRRGLRGAAGVRATCSAPCRPSSAAPGSALDEYAKLRAPAGLRRARPPRWPSTCTATGRASPPTSLRMGDDSCRWILEQAADGEVFAALHGEAGNDMPAAAVGRDGRAGRRRLGDLRPQDLRQPLAGVDLRRLPRHGHAPIPSTRRSSTASCRATPTGYQIVETWDTLGMRATQSQDTVLDKAFVPDELRRAGVPGRASPAPACSTCRIFAWALMGFAAVYLGAAKRAFDITVETHAEAHVDRADPLDGPPPRGAAPRGRDAHRLRRRRGACSSAPAADWAAGVEHAGLAGAARRHPVTSSSTRPSTSSTGPST